MNPDGSVIRSMRPRMKGTCTIRAVDANGRPKKFVLPSDHPLGGRLETKPAVKSSDSVPEGKLMREQHRKDDQQYRQEKLTELRDLLENAIKDKQEQEARDHRRV